MNARRHLIAFAFLAWATAQGSACPNHTARDHIAPQTTHLAQGRKLYTKYGCQACHGEQGIGIGDLRQAYYKYTDEQLKQYIRNPRAFGNQRMPIFSSVIPDADFPALIAYVRSLGTQAAGRARRSILVNRASAMKKSHSHLPENYRAGDTLLRRLYLGSIIGWLDGAFVHGNLSRGVRAHLGSNIIADDSAKSFVRNRGESP